MSRTRTLRIPRLAALLAAALAASLLAAPTASADTPQGPNGGTVGWKYSESGRGYYQDPEGGATGGSGKWTYFSEIEQPSWYCNGRDDCMFDGGNGGHGMWCNPDLSPRVRRPIYVKADWRYTDATQSNPDEWEYLGVACYQTPEWVPVEEISWHFEHEVRRRLPDPDIELRPYPQTLVHLPVIVSTPDIGPQDYEFTIPPSQGRTVPLHGTIHAVPHYTWVFGSGKTVHGAGRPYDGTDPRSAPGYYVTETFDTTGSRTVELRVRWTGTVTVEGLAPEPIDPVVLEDSATVDVVESRAALRDG